MTAKEIALIQANNDVSRADINQQKLFAIFRRNFSTKALVDCFMAMHAYQQRMETMHKAIEELRKEKDT